MARQRVSADTVKSRARDRGGADSQRLPVGALQRITNRHIYYFSGFDPRGARYYHRLYREEAAKQAALTGTRIEVGPRLRAGELSKVWTVRSAGPDGVTETVYEFMRWDDIVRRHWTRNEARLAVELVRTAWAYVASGTLWRILKTAWPPFVTGLYPVLYFLALVTAAVFAALGLGGWLGRQYGIVAGGAGAAAAAVSVLYLGRLVEKRLRCYWLLRIYAFTVRQAGGLPELEARIDRFAEYMARQIAGSQADEILVVGHSVGTTIACSTLARALARMPKVDRRIALVTLGQCIPMLSLLPQAQKFREDLARLGSHPEVEWIDFTAPTDGACFALTDPLQASGIPGVRDIPRPKLLSPRFMTLFDAKTYARIRRNWFRNHFQYLMAGDKVGDYDYFAITAGPVPLAERYAAHRSVVGYRRFKVFG